MKLSLLDILVCPDCKGQLKCEVHADQNDEIKEGILSCNQCRKSYKISNFIPRFVFSDEYVDNFSFEWHKHRTTQLDSRTGTNESTENFKRITGFNLNELKEKLILDAGCGSGRYSEVAA